MTDHEPHSATSLAGLSGGLAVLLLALLLVVASPLAAAPAAPTASAAPSAPGPVTVSYVVKSGDLLPQVDADIETVTIEPWGACELTHWRRFSTDATNSLFPLPLDVPWTMTTRYRMAIGMPSDEPAPGSTLIDDVLQFADATDSGVLTLDPAQAAHQQHVLGPFTNPIAGGVQPTVIRDDVRCDIFEGTGELWIGGGWTNWLSLYGAPGVTADFPLGDARYRFHDLRVRVTYELK